MKLKLTLLAALLGLSLAGCGAEARPFESADLNTVLESGVFSDQIEKADAEIICMMYGLELNGDAVASCEGYLSGGASAEELVLFTAPGEAEAERVKAACELRIQDQILGYEDYMPGEVAKLENAVIALRGNTVLVVVANDSAAAAELVNGLN